MHPIARPFQLLYFAVKNSRKQLTAECRLKNILETGKDTFCQVADINQITFVSCNIPYSNIMFPILQTKMFPPPGHYHLPLLFYL
jgi:hypothetical protein